MSEIIQDTAENGSDSRIAKVSVRALIAFFPVFTVCILSVMGVDAAMKTLDYLAVGAAGWYLGQKKTT